MRPRLTCTYTYVTMSVPREFYELVLSKLQKEDYYDNLPDDLNGPIDMRGLALIPEDNEASK